MTHEEKERLLNEIFEGRRINRVRLDKDGEMELSVDGVGAVVVSKEEVDYHIETELENRDYDATYNEAYSMDESEVE